MAYTLTFKLETADGASAEPPELQTTAARWRAGDTIPLGYRMLRVTEFRDGGHAELPVLVVEDAGTTK